MSVEKALDSVLVATVFGRQQADDRIAALSRRVLEHIGRELQGLPDFEFVQRLQGSFGLPWIGRREALRFVHDHSSL